MQNRCAVHRYRCAGAVTVQIHKKTHIARCASQSVKMSYSCNLARQCALKGSRSVKTTPHNENHSFLRRLRSRCCGALLKFCVLTLRRFHSNTSSITAKPSLVSTQNLLANRLLSHYAVLPERMKCNRFVLFYSSSTDTMPLRLPTSVIKRFTVQLRGRRSVKMAQALCSSFSAARVIWIFNTLTLQPR